MQAAEASIATTTSPGRTRPGPSSCVGLDHAGGRAGDVVLVGAEQAGVLGGLAADQRAAGLARSASAMPLTIAAIRSGTTRPRAM